MLEINSILLYYHIGFNSSSMIGSELPTVGGGAGGVPDHDSQRKKTPFHISRGK